MDKPYILLPQSVVSRIMGNSRMMRGMSVAGSGDSPVCPKCERVALRDIGYTENKIAQCPHCGYRGRMEVTLAEYSRKKLYK